MKVEIKNLCKSFGEKHVLTDVSYYIDRPGILKIKGPSGSGKTTLFRIIAGLEKADKGIVNIEGKVVYMFQEPRLFENFSILENVTLGDNEKKEKATEILTKLNLGDELEKKAELASGGMKQRASFARAVLAAENADVLLLDEPISAQDPENAEKIKEIIENLSKKKIVLLISHS